MQNAGHTHPHPHNEQCHCVVCRPLERPCGCSACEAQSISRKSLRAELDRRASQGRHPSTLAHITAQLASIGYKLDRTGDCPCNARYISGEHAGESYPCTTTSIREIDTGLPAWHYPDARRDANFKQLQAWRASGDLFAVINGSILEI